jgi:hypothetical protein
LHHHIQNQSSYTLWVFSQDRYLPVFIGHLQLLNF